MSLDKIRIWKYLILLFLESLECHGNNSGFFRNQQLVLIKGVLLFITLVTEGVQEVELG